MLNARFAAVSMADIEDPSLVARASAGDRAAARILYDRHADRVYRLAYRMCGDRDLSADLTQDVFVRVFRQLGRFRGDAAFTTWLHRVAVTTCLNGLRGVKRMRRREVDLDQAEWLASGAAERDPVLVDALASAIDALQPGLRIALVMHALEGYTHSEIAAALGIAEGTSKSRVFEARAKLQQMLAGHGREYRDD